MRIINNSAVSFHFTLKVDGQQIESSFGDEPLAYLHGHKAIVPGLEDALNGKAKGDKFNITLPPEKAYGVRNEGLVQKVPRQDFPEELEAGMQFQVDTPQGPMVVTVTQVTDSEVTIDANPEMAGQTLNFEIEVMDVRAATAEELAHGHVHGPGGHHHG
ncbi:MAG: peptidylprolyl isomerase [Bdellovibrionales bacterium]|nr:peptidylprolyl isomerase [Bdellovibrionales bacterium]